MRGRGRPKKDVTREASLAAWITDAEMELLDRLLSEHDPYLTRSSFVRTKLHEYFGRHGYDPRTLTRIGNNGKSGSSGHAKA